MLLLRLCNIPGSILAHAEQMFSIPFLLKHLQNHLFPECWTDNGLPVDLDKINQTRVYIFQDILFAPIQRHGYCQLPTCLLEVVILIYKDQTFDKGRQLVGLL